MSLTAPEIRMIRQRLGWSVAEMARRMGCKADLIQGWEAGTSAPDQDAINQLRHLHNHLEIASTQVQQKPLVEKTMEERRMAQLTHRDCLKDLQ